MSVTAILTGVETRLRSAAVLNDPNGKICGIQADGQPPTGCGQFYYAIWWPDTASNESEGRNPLDWNVVYNVTVTITARMGYSPKDRRGSQLKANLMALAEAITAPLVIHANYAEVLLVANQNIPGTAEWGAIHVPPVSATVNGFIEPLSLFDFGPCKRQTPSWVGGDDSGDGEKHTIYSCDVRFGGARRVQVL